MFGGLVWGVRISGMVGHGTERLTIKAVASDKSHWRDELPPEFEADQNKREYSTDSGDRGLFGQACGRTGAAATRSLSECRHFCQQVQVLPGVTLESSSISPVRFEIIVLGSNSYK